MKQILLILFTIISISILAQPKWFRLTYRDDPSTTISIGWTGTSGTLYYDTVDYGNNHSQYANSQTTDRTTSYKGNTHYYVRLTNLYPGTVYYFTVQYSSTATASYSFQTISDDPNQAISFISGGDSRKDLSLAGIGDPPCWGISCRQTRRDLNTIVSRVRPDFVAFTGDYIRNYDVPFLISSEDDWTEWFDDWTYANGPDNRLTPVIHSLGNHEDAADLDNLFDISNVDVYYASNFSGNLLRLYTLNSEPTDVCNDLTQKNWLENDLQQNSMPSNTPYWKIVQYHQPMVPHANYSSRTDMINCWSPYFKQYGVRLVCESHAHVMKTTYPLVYDANAANSYNGLVREDTLGAVFIGDGSWGAPPRTAYSPISNVTQDVEQTSGFFFINVNQQRIEIHPIIPFSDSIAGVPQLLDDIQGTNLPSGVPLWRPANGSETIIIPRYPLAIEDNERSHNTIVSPNPSNNFVTVNFADKLADNVSIQIYNARGKLCEKIDNINGKTYEIDISNLCLGVNFINIVSKYDVESHKIIVVK